MSEEFRYFRNATPNSIRVMDISLSPRGKRDVVKVDLEKAADPKFAPSVGSLLEEIDEETYLERIKLSFDDEASSAQKQQRFVADFHGDDTIPVRNMVPYHIRKQVQAGDYGIAGAASMTVGREDPAKGKTLSDIRQQNSGDSAQISGDEGLLI